MKLRNVTLGAVLVLFLSGCANEVSAKSENDDIREMEDYEFIIGGGRTCFFLIRNRSNHHDSETFDLRKIKSIRAMPLGNKKDEIYILSIDNRKVAKMKLNKFLDFENRWLRCTNNLIY